jgi:DNA-binding MarR family transcriptional regulator
VSTTDTAETADTAKTAAPTTPMATATTTATALRLGDALGRLARVIRRAHVAPLGSSSTSALVTVIRCGPIRLGDLADREGVTPATLSRVVLVLEREGYVERVTDPSDRRSAFLAATERGRDSIDRLRVKRAEVLSSRIARLTESERASLTAALEVLERLVED